MLAPALTCAEVARGRDRTRQLESAVARHGGTRGERPVLRLVHTDYALATWSQLGLHRKPLVLLDVNGFWDPLVDLLNQMVITGLLKAANRELIQTARSPEEALQLLATAEPVRVEKWITADER